MRRAVRWSTLVFMSSALGAGCGGDNATVPRDASNQSQSAPMSSAAAEKAAGSASISRVGAMDAAQPAPPASPEQVKSENPAAVVAPSMVIRNGSASVQVDSLELAIAAVQRLATTFGGYVGNTSVVSGEYQVRSATLELKIPAARFDEALSGLKPIGKVESVSSTAEDVGEEFVDVNARVNNARKLEERLVMLLATRTGKLEDVLAVERELARVREEIERYEGRIRYLRTRVATSTLTITVHERAPIVSAAPGENIMLDAFKNAWRNFVRFLAGTISSLGVLIPVGIILLLGARAWKRMRPAPAATDKKPESTTSPS